MYVVTLTTDKNTHHGPGLISAAPITYTYVYIRTYTYIHVYRREEEDALARCTANKARSLLPCTRSLLPYNRSLLPYTRSLLPQTRSLLPYTRSLLPYIEDRRLAAAGIVPYMCLFLIYVPIIPYMCLMQLTPRCRS